MIKTALSSQVLMYTILSAVCFSGWNLIARKAGVGQAWLTLIVCATTLTTILVYNAPKAIHSEITKASILILVIAGITNGFGFIFYGKALDSGQTHLSILLPVLFGSMVLFSFLGGIWFYNDPTSSTKNFGVGFIILGIYLMNQ